jgi:hypothetical protein
VEHIGGWRVVTTNQRSTTKYRLESKRRKEKITQKHNQEQHFIKQNIHKKYRVSLTDSQAKDERVCYIYSKERKLQEKANSMPPQQQAPWR